MHPLPQTATYCNILQHTATHLLFRASEGGRGVGRRGTVGRVGGGGKGKSEERERARRGREGGREGERQPGVNMGYGGSVKTLQFFGLKKCNLTILQCNMKSGHPDYRVTKRNMPNF